MSFDTYLKMDGSRMLSGSELVAKGATKRIDGQLPELGTKEVSPSGSWLEQKQIQSALEARKHLIEVERIEKNGSLSHAIWRDDLKLAEVIKKTGGHWQFLGHNVGKNLYLLPEETLFLIENNSLLLKHNDVTVSLQKAYSLCLNDKVSIEQYKVYASLGRLGYRVFRHKEPPPDIKKESKITTNENNLTDSKKNSETNQTVSNSKEQSDYGNKKEISESHDKEQKAKCTAKAMTKISSSISNEGADVNCLVKNDNVVASIDSDCVTEHSTDSKGIENGSDNSVEINLLAPSLDSSQEIKVAAEKNCVITKNVAENCSNQTEKQAVNVPRSDKVELTTIRDGSSEKMMTDNKYNVLSENNMALVVRGKENNSNESIGVITEYNENITQTVKTKALEISSQNTIYSVDKAGVIRVFKEDNLMDTETAEPNLVDPAINLSHPEVKDPGLNVNSSNKHFDAEINHYNTKIQKLIKRKLYTCQRSNFEALNKIEDFYHKQVVSVNAPYEDYLPRNIFLHKTTYEVNVDVIRNQNSSNMNSSDEMYSREVPNRMSRFTDAPRLTDLSRFKPKPPTNNPSHTYSNYRSPSQWYPRVIETFYNYNAFRPPTQGFFLHPRYRYQPHAFTRHPWRHMQPSGNNHGNGVPRDTLKQFHFKAIQHIALKFKSGIGRPHQVQTMQNLLATFNARYDERLRLSMEFDIIDTKNETPEVPREVIVLDDEPPTKKPRLNDTDKINGHLEKLKELAVKLKDLHTKSLAVSRHRRVFSNALKTFNKSFNADLYLDSDFEIRDRRLIVLDSSSDSDDVISLNEKEKCRKRKRLNPFNVLKHGFKNVNVGASTSRDVPILQTLSLNVINDASSTTQNSPNTSAAPDNDGKDLLKYFDKAWLPSDGDFGRAELCSKEKGRLNRLLFEAEYLQEVLKESAEFETWLDLKLAVLKEIQGRLDIQKQQADALSNDFLMETESQIKPILQSNCTDLKSALQLLAIITTNKDIPTETSLKIHFDVCNRNVHFKKSSPPKPNFRIVCCEESAPFPTCNDVVALQAKYDDSVPIVFAFVGTSSSISYLQINSTELPVFIPDNDLT